MKKSVVLSFLYLCVSLFCFSQSSLKSAKTYTNPLKTTVGKVIDVADPFVYEYKGIYYMTGTCSLQKGEGFACYTSKDLVHWRYRGLLYSKPYKHIGSSCFWAPEVKYYDGKFYMTYSCFVKDKNLLMTCLAVSDTPAGPFKDLYTPWFDLGYSAIDADIFIDTDNTPYLYFSKNGMVNNVATGEIYVVKLKKDLSGLDGTPVFVSKASQPWEKVKWDSNQCNEGPFVFKRGDTYYMTYSGNDTGYEYYGVGVSYAKSPLGPWTKSENNPLMTTDTAKGISSPGHNSIVQAPDGSLYIVYHRHADPNCQKPNWTRVVCIDKLYFDKDGKLKVDGPTNSAQHISW